MTDYAEQLRKYNRAGQVQYEWFEEAATYIEDLEERLKAATDDAKAAEAYAEELEADNKGLRHMILDQINSTGDGPEIMAATRAEWAARALAAEAKLARATEALENFIRLDEDYSPFGGEMMEDRVERTWDNARAILEELKGDSDEQTTDSHDY